MLGEGSNYIVGGLVLWALGLLLGREWWDAVGMYRLGVTWWKARGVLVDILIPGTTIFFMDFYRVESMEVVA